MTIIYTQFYILRRPTILLRCLMLFVVWFPTQVVEKPTVVLSRYSAACYIWTYVSTGPSYFKGDVAKHTILMEN